MGDFSSRESLDVVLSNSELEILQLSAALVLDLKLYARLVDDISVICQGSFCTVVELIEMMAEKYPNMPLNFQLSFGYSRFLDLHIFNCAKILPQNHYKLTYSLAYKGHSSFCYTPRYSNIHKKYKHAVVPISLFRIHTRCSEKADINHHLYFMSRIVKNRDQDPIIVKKKTLQFFKKKNKLKSGIVKKSQSNIKSTSITFDDVSKSHLFLNRIVVRSFSSRLRIVYKSRPKLSSILCPKRMIIRKLSRHFIKPE